MQQPWLSLALCSRCLSLRSHCAPAASVLLEINPLEINPCARHVPLALRRRRPR
jgi:hypothetical protein